MRGCYKYRFEVGFRKTGIVILNRKQGIHPSLDKKKQKKLGRCINRNIVEPIYSY